MSTLWLSQYHRIHSKPRQDTVYSISENCRWRYAMKLYMSIGAIIDSQTTIHFCYWWLSQTWSNETEICHRCNSFQWSIRCWFLPKSFATHYYMPQCLNAYAPFIDLFIFFIKSVANTKQYMIHIIVLYLKTFTWISTEKTNDHNWLTLILCGWRWLAWLYHLGSRYYTAYKKECSL